MRQKYKIQRFDDLSRRGDGQKTEKREMGIDLSQEKI